MEKSCPVVWFSLFLKNGLIDWAQNYYITETYTKGSNFYRKNCFYWIFSTIFSPSLKTLDFFMVNTNFTATSNTPGCLTLKFP